MWLLEEVEEVGEVGEVGEVVQAVPVASVSWDCPCRRWKARTGMPRETKGKRVQDASGS